MSAGTLITLEEYLKTSYSPDREFRDGVILERNRGNKGHARLQMKLGAYLNRRRIQWNIDAYTELRVRVRENWYPIPDVCVYPAPEFEGEYPTTAPLLWIEILSPDDRMVDVWAKATELVENGVPLVWIIDPNTLESEVRTPEGLQSVHGETLHVPNSPIVIPLREALDE